MTRTDVAPFLKAKQVISIKSEECVGRQSQSPKETCLVVSKY